MNTQSQWRTWQGGGVNVFAPHQLGNLLDTSYTFLSRQVLHDVSFVLLAMVPLMDFGEQDVWRCSVLRKTGSS